MPQVIITDDGFAPDDWSAPISAAAEGVSADTRAVEVTEDTQLETVAPHLDRLDLIRVTFPSFADGRGFTLGRRLRAMGYRGRLRAQGHVLADQYAMARRSGFDEVEIDADLARRQPEDQWLGRADWRDHDYQARLRG